MRDRCAPCGTRKILALLLLCVLWGFSGGSAPGRAGDLYESRLDQGLFNTEPYSYLLISAAHQDRTSAKRLLEEARKYSPDLPAVYFELAKESFSFSAEGVFQALDYFRQGVKAYTGNFRWEFSAAGLTLVSLVLSFVLSLALLAAIRLPKEAGLVLHDCREEKKRLLLPVLPLFLSLFGPVAFLAGVFFLAGFYFKRESKVVVYGALVFFLVSPFLMNEGTILLSSPSSLRAIAEVNEGKDNWYALRVLKGRYDFPSSFSYALALKREGYYQEAIDAYKGIEGRLPGQDPRVFVNLGNAYYGMKDLEKAEEAYRKAIEVAPLPSAYYNLSQLRRELLDFAGGDKYFLAAAKLSPEEVSKFASVSSGNPNRFVVDETLPISALWEYTTAGGNNSFSPLQSAAFLIAALMIPGFYFLERRLKFRAQRCKRCGAVFCARCLRTIVWGEMCPRCYSSLIKIEEIDSRERIARLLFIYQSQAKRRETAKIAGYLLPGAGHIYSGKMLFGLLFLWLFLFSLVLLVMNAYYPTGLYPFTHAWVTPLAAVLIVAAYAGSVFHIRRRIHKGWL
ncbi:MAG: tetratricopeptide repeat protein [Nitrospirae bacterium]|nr:tetratricopeptide repeat protein [Nitrospirota bacterium]